MGHRLQALIEQCMRFAVAMLEVTIGCVIIGIGHYLLSFTRKHLKWNPHMTMLLSKSYIYYLGNVSQLLCEIHCMVYMYIVKC